MSASFDLLLRRLVEAEVEFVLVGGLALGTWGVVRGTKDVDIVPSSEPENIARLARLAVELNGHVQLAESMLASEPSITAALGAGDQVAIETELGRLDIVQGLDGVPSYEKLKARSIEVDVLGTRVYVCSLEDLRSMKKASARTRDLADLEDLDSSQT
jgi:predicted nucleotidyltransferase